MLSLRDSGESPCRAPQGMLSVIGYIDRYGFRRHTNPPLNSQPWAQPQDTFRIRSLTCLAESCWPQRDPSHMAVTPKDFKYFESGRVGATEKKRCGATLVLVRDVRNYVKKPGNGTDMKEIYWALQRLNCSYCITFSHTTVGGRKSHFGRWKKHRRRMGSYKIAAAFKAKTA